MRKDAMKALAVGLVGVCAGSAVGQTVAWYAMEGEIGARAETAIENHAAPGRLRAEPRSLVGARAVEGTASNPTYAPGFPAGWTVLEPVGGARRANPTALRFGAQGLGGSAGILETADDKALRLTTFTLEMFVRFGPDEPAGKWWQALAVKPGELPGEKTDSWGLRITGEDEITVRFTSPGGREPMPPQTLRAKGLPLNDGQWHHVALVVDNVWGYSARLYFDYVLRDEHGMPWEVWYGPTPLFVGATRQTPGPVRGCIDEVRLSDAALKPEQFLRPAAEGGASVPPELTALLKGFEASKNPKTRTLKVERESITWQKLKSLDPGLKPIGRLATRSSDRIVDSKWSVGCETLDRDYADFTQYARFVGELGVKRGRLFSGWAKTEREKGVYDFAWLDRQVRGLDAMGVRPWICLSYGNPVYKSGLNLGAGVAGVMGNPEGRAAWLRYCGEVVRRYKDVVREWEIWNEPFGKQMPAYAEMLDETAAVIRGIQPDATVMASAVGAYANNEEVLKLLEAKGRATAIDCWHYHPYIPNPDEPNGWWGYDTVEKLRRLVARYNPKARLVQGEVGCPAQLEFGHALCNRSWTEYSQAKWTLRRMTGEAVRGIAYNVFSMVDLQYKDYMLQSFGLLRMDLGKRFVYRRPNFYAVQNEVNLLDCDATPIGLDENVPFAFVRRADIRETGSRKMTCARFSRKGSQLAFVWYSDRIPDDTLDWDRVSVALPAAFREPVWVEMITGRVFALGPEDFSVADKSTEFKSLPVWDAPVLIAEREGLDLAR